MLSKTMLGLTFMALGFAALSAPVVADAEDVAGAMRVIDTDHDGTIDLVEAKTAGMAIFNSTDKDSDGTIDKKEGSTMMPVDTDKDGTVDKAEYGKAVEAAFNKADAENDGKIDDKELSSPAGEDLRTMIVPKG